MSRGEEMARQWHISLRFLFGLVALLAFEIWLFQRGPVVSFFAPLVVALFLEAAGYPKASRCAAVVTLLWWLLFPILLAIFFEP